MKPPAKPITSPGRSDKYPTPTPLMTSFMRINVGNKSRSGRLRSTSPMFTRKKNTTPETQEPSSPKVTCMGQVRGPTAAPAAFSLRRDKRAGAPARRKQKNSCGELWRKWVPSFGAVFCYNAKIEEDKERRETRIGEEEEEEAALGFRLDDDEEERGFERKARAFVYANNDNDDVTSAPPKNALLLTRCRSAPYRSTSLAYRFWSSPNRSQEENVEQSQTGEEEQSQTGEEEKEEQKIENEGPTLESEKRNEENIEVLAASVDLKKAGEFNGSDSERPLILTRCKSEPARTAAEKLEVDSLIHSHQQAVVIN